jgi:hypothetical protein
MRKHCEHGLSDRYKNGRCRPCKLAGKRRRRLAQGSPRKTFHEREYAKRWSKLPRGRASYLIHQIRKRCREKGLPAPTISCEWIAERIIRGTCEVSGAPFKRDAGRRNPFSASVDRVDSSKGYDPENCRLVLWALNAAFAEWGADAFAEIAEAWLAHRRKGRDLI